MRFAGVVCVAIAVPNCALAADTCPDGVATAVPVKDGRPPVIDGKLDDWDLSGGVSVWIADELADRQHCRASFMYDDDNFYVAARLALMDHELRNDCRPFDKYWYGDNICLRYCTDRSLPFPLPNKFTSKGGPAPLYARNRKVGSVTLWRDTRNGNDWMLVLPGANFDCGTVTNPVGSAVKVIGRGREATIEARIPWRSLGVEDGRNPFRPGEMMTAELDVHWHPGTDGYSAAAIYRVDPGTFAFRRLENWGRILFSPTGNLRPGKSVFDIAAEAVGKARAKQSEGATEIAFEIPKRGRVSVLIRDGKGGVLKELMGGEAHAPGIVRAYWDGRDAYGHPCAVGKAYRWEAYMNDGISAEWFGTVGTEGDPPYETPDGKGGWGADHGPAIAAAADETGRYFIWYTNESGCGLVKTDFDGKVVWRSAPFVCGGFGDFTCGVAVGGSLYVVFDGLGRNKSKNVARIDAATGDFMPFDGVNTINLGFSQDVVELQPGCCLGPFKMTTAGIATDGERLFVSDFTGGRIAIHDRVTGRRLGEWPCPGVRGLSWREGCLYAATIAGRIVRLDGKTGLCETYISDNLSAPYGLAFDSKGNLHVTDWGQSHQLKTFSPNGRLIRTLGQKGGRGFLGAYDSKSFSFPASLACDKTDTLIVPEMASPKVFSLISAATGETLRRMFGYTAYSPSNLPDCDDPLLQYYSISGPESFARARIPDAGGIGRPDASWDFRNAGIGEFDCVFDTMTMGEVVRASNGWKYLVPDGEGGMPTETNARHPRTICRIDGDQMVPVVSFALAEPDPDPRTKTNALRVWTDGNGDGRIQENEVRVLDRISGRRFTWAVHSGSLQMDAHGHVYLTTMQNCLIEIPASGFDDGGVPKLDVSAARIAVPEIIPGLAYMFCSWRSGAVGWRRDSQGNFYSVVFYPRTYASEGLTQKMKTGMGHTSRFTTVEFVKYAPDGRVLWKTGRKATSAPKHGEIMHPWCMAGLIGDDYVVMASEWGPFWLYTHDGFYAGQLFDSPGLPGRGIPYRFGGEDFSGQIRYFPCRDEVWAYNAGHTYCVKGFHNGRICGERRFSGEVLLERIKPLDEGGGSVRELRSGQVVSFADDQARVRIVRRAEDLECLFDVTDETPLVNVARAIDRIFKGGDAVGVELGPLDGKGLDGCVRIVAAKVDDGIRVVGMKPLTRGEKRPQTYSTPSGGDASFEWVGEIPGADAVAEVRSDGTGYRLRFRVPYEFLEFDIRKGACAVEAEVLFSGEGGRGMGVGRRTYLCHPVDVRTTMTDDTPTEARLYREGWGVLK
ncbi:MAG: hypothetical protein PUJ80_02335 [Verrucomicrobiota bacterium]|nr:hypothetical protein [Verrucomicrobiota bacterium]